MDNIEKGLFLKLFNRGGQVLDFTTADFDTFTMESVGVAVCSKYGLSKGKSLVKFISESSEENTNKLLLDLLRYYENLYQQYLNLDICLKQMILILMLFFIEDIKFHTYYYYINIIKNFCIHKKIYFRFSFLFFSVLRTLKIYFYSKKYLR